MKELNSANNENKLIKEKLSEALSVNQEQRNIL